MEEQLISFETAKLAKEKGFDASCYDAFNSKGNLYSNGWCEYLYDNKVEIPFRSGVLESQDVLAPTQSLLAKWLREEHNIHLIAYKNINIDGYDWCYITTDGITNINSYKTYEEAYEIGLQEALKLINNK